MATVTFDEIHARVAAFHVAENARNAPAAQARRCVYELSSLLAELDSDERTTITNLIIHELLSLPILGK